MSDIFDKIIKKFEEEAGTLEGKMLLFAVATDAKKVSQWVDESYLQPGEGVPVAVIPLSVAKATCWLLDKARMAPRQIIEGLAKIGIRAEYQVIADTDLIYCPPDRLVASIEAAGAARWN